MKLVYKIIAGCFFWLCFVLAGTMPVYGAEPVVVVLDPGHGGKNLGAEYDGYTEKDMTMIVATAMKEELEKYEGVEVYLTRDVDKDMSLEERAEFAASKNADFLFCLHFNMSLGHELFGSEVWISAFGEEHQKGYSFASAEMELLEDAGLYPRGIKTRLNDDGEDYYGIIRHSTARGLPSAIIEHCHLDEETDVAFYDSEEKLKQFGVLDATAVAKFYGLKSEILGVDYGSYQKVEIPIPSAAVKPDTSEPDVCMIDAGDVDKETGEAEVSIYAVDYDSYLVYYSYSLDGGESFSKLQKWEPRSADTLKFTLKVPSGIAPDLVVKVYNKYDYTTMSNHVYFPSVSYEEEEKGEGISKMEEMPEGSTDGEAVEAGVMTAKNPSPGETGTEGEKGKKEKTGNNGQPAKEATVLYFLQVAFLCAAILFVLFLLAGILMGGRRSKKKRRRKK